MLNELSVQYSSNAISSDTATTPEHAATAQPHPGTVSGEPQRLIPTATVERADEQIGAPQLFDNDYQNLTITDNLSWQRGRHSFQGRLPRRFERKNEISGSATQGTRVHAGGGFSAFQNFLRGNRDGACGGGGASYTEPELETTTSSASTATSSMSRIPGAPLSERHGRLRTAVRALSRRSRTKNDVLTNFDPAAYKPRQRPRL